MIDVIWRRRKRHPGHTLALLSAAFFGINILLIIGVAAGFAVAAATGDATFHDLLTRSAFPVLLYAAWGLGVFGSAGAICAVAIYGYRERWFWRWMIVASVSWLLMPPVHTVIGLVALAALVHHRSHFMNRQPANAPPPQ